MKTFRPACTNRSFTLRQSLDAIVLKKQVDEAHDKLLMDIHAILEAAGAQPTVPIGTTYGIVTADGGHIVISNDCLVVDYPSHEAKLKAKAIQLGYTILPPL